MRIALAASVTANEINIGALPSAIDVKGTFKFTGVTPGQYSLNLASPDGRSQSVDGWWLKSASISGHDAADGTVDLSTMNVSDAVVVLTRTVASVVGTVQDPGGAPLPNQWVVAFPANRQMWTATCRRCRGTWSAPVSGQYELGPLPPGEYLIAVPPEANYRDLFNPASLARFAVGAVRVTVTQGERRTVDLRVPGR